MRIHFDSKKCEHKTPFGTVRAGECCSFMICVPTSCKATGVGLILEDCDGKLCREVSFTLKADDETYQQWCGSFTMECGLYFYWFRIYQGDSSFRLFKQGSLTNMEAGEKWQVSFIPADFTTPDYAKGAVMYQIMPDRFYKSGECDLTDKLQPYTVQEDWYALPRYGPDAQGHWNNDFFGGNFAGIREKLPYLKEFGVGVLYLNPIFMAFSSHRYDTADYKRPDPMLGTQEDFKALCDEAHRLGMRVILDGVFSHTGDNSIYFDSQKIFGNGAVSNPDSPYRAWYRFYEYPDDYDAWWSIKTLPCVEELTPSYLDYIIEDADSVAAHWIRLGADGFRLDVADELPDEFILRLKKRIRAIKPDAMLLGEVWEDASNKRAYDVSRRYFVDGELDSVMNYPWRTAIIDFVNGTDDGAAFAECVETIAENYPPQVLACVMNLLSSHDRARILTVLGDDFDGSKEEKAKRRLSPESYHAARELLKMASFLQFTLPGMPSIYYGDEAGLEGFEDPYCRRTFPWGREDVSLQAYFRSLGHLKTELPALRCGDIRICSAKDGRLHFWRRSEMQEAEIFVNRTDENWELPKNGTLRFAYGLCTDGIDRGLLPNGFCLMEYNK